MNSYRGMDGFCGWRGGGVVARLVSPPRRVNCTMTEKFRSCVGVIVAVCTGVLLVAGMSGCSDREKAASADVPDVRVPEAPVVDPGGQLRLAQTQLQKVKREWANDIIRLGRMQKEAVKATPRIAAMEQEFLKEKQVFVDRMNSWPAIRKLTERKAGYLEKVQELVEEREKIVAQLKAADSDEAKQEMGAKLQNLGPRFGAVRDDIRAVTKEIERVREQIRTTDPEMKAMHAKLVEKKLLIYVGEVNRLPEIAKLREIQEARRKQIRMLEDRIAGRETEGGRDNRQDRPRKPESKELMING